MTDFLNLFLEAKGVLGGAGAMAVATFVYLWTQRDQRKLDSANSEANVNAINHWQEVAARADAALAAMTQRADKFADERNEAYRALAKLEGRIEELTRQLEAQNNLIINLREQIAHLEGQIRAMR